MSSKDKNYSKDSCKSECENSSKECKGKVIESNTLCECSSESESNYPHVKVPVVIAEFTVQIDNESKIKLAHPAIEIKRIKKNVFLTQCRLIGRTGKVFISGYVRKNIEYATVDSKKDSTICGDIKHTTVYVPFKCVTKLENMRKPVLHHNPSAKEITYYDQKKMGVNMKETDFFNEEFFNEKIFCELVKAKIYEANIVEDYEKLDCNSDEYVFQRFIEKEVIYLKIKLLQKQQVYLDRPYKNC